jgi:hypothetical protein
MPTGYTEQGPESPRFSTKVEKRPPRREVIFYRFQLVQVGRTFPDGTVELIYTRPPD